MNMNNGNVNDWNRYMIELCTDYAKRYLNSKNIQYKIRQASTYSVYITINENAYLRISDHMKNTEVCGYSIKTINVKKISKNAKLKNIKALVERTIENTIQASKYKNIYDIFDKI